MKARSMTLNDNTDTLLETDQTSREAEDDLVTQHESNHLLSDRPNATRWVIQHHGKTMTAVKVKRRDDRSVYISEVAVLNSQYHWVNGKFKLSLSYRPYIDNQWYAVVPEDSEGFHLTPDIQLHFFQPGGVELRNDKADRVTPFPALKKASMSQSLTDGLSMALVHVEEIAEANEPEPVLKNGMLITGSAAAGKTTLVGKLRKAGYDAIDGDTFGQAIRFDDMPYYQKLYLWVQSEMREMVMSKDVLGQLDGVLDALGALFAYAATQPPELVDQAIDEYVKSQVERNRPEHFFYEMFNILRAPEADDVNVMDTIFHERYNDSGKEPLVWHMNWEIDVDTCISAMKSGNIVAVTGNNIEDLMAACVKEDIPIVHLGLNHDVLISRFDKRMRAYHDTGRYPHGIKDFEPAMILKHALRINNAAIVHGARMVYKDRGDWNADDVL
jgi:hypothetical protein